MKIGRLIISDIERKKDEKFLVYDIFSKKFFNVNKNVALALFRKDEKSCEVYKYLSDKLYKEYYLKEYIIDKKKLNMVRILVTNKCNLNCKYCYANAGTYGEKCRDMNFNTYSKVCEYLEKKYKSIGEVNFFGGEPTLNIDAIEYICKYFNEKYKFKTPTFSMVTNGTNLNDEMLDLINKYNIHIIVSLDSTNKHVNDSNRIFKDGRGTFDIVDRNIMKLRKNISNKIVIESTYTEEHVKNNISYTDIMLENYKKYKIKLNIIQNENGNDRLIKKIKDSSIDNSLSRDIDTFIKYGISNSRLLSFLNSIYATCYSGYFCDAFLGQIAIDPCGDIYPCQMFIASNIDNSLKKFKVGDVFYGDFNSEFIINYVEKYNKKNIRLCKNCFSKPTCKQCMFDKYVSSSSKNSCRYTFSDYYTNLNYFINLISDEKIEKDIRRNINELSDVYFQFTR